MYSLKEEHPLNPVLTVSQLTNRIRDTLEAKYDAVMVVGEVSNAKLYPSGHWYFSLKDQEATLPCVCFKNSSMALKFKLEDGLQVVARGKLSVYPPRGAYQMIVSGIEPVGIGEWQLAFEQLKKKLEQEGLLDPALKKVIPMLPRRVGVVTSPAGAALRDIFERDYPAQSRCFGIDLTRKGTRGGLRRGGRSGNQTSRTTGQHRCDHRRPRGRIDRRSLVF